MSLSEILGGLNKEDQAIMQAFTQPGAAFNEFILFLEELNVLHGSTIIATRGIGSSFILRDPLWGLLGVQTPQAFLGDSRVAFTTQLTRTVNRTFVDDGKEQVTFFLVNSGAAVQPAQILIGSGTTAWASGDSSLQFMVGSRAIDSQGGTGNKFGSWITTFTGFDIAYVERGITETGVSGGQLLIRDEFSASAPTGGIILGSVGSEMRVQMYFAVGNISTNPGNTGYGLTMF